MSDSLLGARTESDLSAALDTGSTTLHLSLTREQSLRLVHFIGLLMHWTKTYNLTAIRTPEGILTHHILDCLAVVPSLRRRFGARRTRILDVGSGGGLPGVVLAIAMPELAVTCADSVGKKIAFIQQTVAALGLQNVNARLGRVEAITEEFDVIICRAFASLASFARSSERALSASGSWLAMKGKRDDAEIAALPHEIEMFHVEPLHVPGVNADRHLIWLQRRALI